MAAAPITSFYAALAGLIILFLAGMVSRHRLSTGVGMGDGGYRPLQLAIRAHGNAVEYLPICLLLMLLYELEGGGGFLLHSAGLAVIGGRVLHASAMLRTDEGTPARQAGIALTWLAILVLSLALIF